MKKFYLHYESNENESEFTKVFKFIEETEDKLEKYVSIFIKGKKKTFKIHQEPSLFFLFPYSFFFFYDQSYIRLQFKI